MQLENSPSTSFLYSLSLPPSLHPFLPAYPSLLVCPRLPLFSTNSLSSGNDIFFHNSIFDSMADKCVYYIPISYEHLSAYKQSDIVCMYQ